MRLTKDIKKQILANILAGHEITKQAKKLMTESRDLALAITLDQMPKGVTSFVGLQKMMRSYQDTNNGMFSISVYARRATFSHNKDMPHGIGAVYDATFEVNMGGNIRTLSLSGDNYSNRRHRGYWEDRYNNSMAPDIGEIVPGFETALLAALVEINADGEQVPIYMPRGRADYPAEHEFCKRLDKNDKSRRELRAKYDEFKLSVMGTLDKYTTDTKLIKAWPEVKQFITQEEKKSTAVALDVKTLNEICGIPR